MTVPSAAARTGVPSATLLKGCPYWYVCQQFAVSYAHTFDMLRDLEVSFEWTPP
jgi:hypothetical protein